MGKVTQFLTGSLRFWSGKGQDEGGRVEGQGFTLWVTHISSPN